MPGMSTPGMYRLREIDPTNGGDIERMNLMFLHPSVRCAMGYKRLDQYLSVKPGELQILDKSLVNKNKVKKQIYDDVSYAVVDLKDKLVGWIWFCQDKRHPFPKMVAKRLGVNLLHTPSYQIVYEKLLSDNWPKHLMANIVHTPLHELNLPRKGVIVSGLDMAIKSLKRKLGKRIALYAYVLPDNKASAIVLGRNSFEKVVRQYNYDKVVHDLWVKII